jgi:NAD(P)H-flavin reductase
MVWIIILVVAVGVAAVILMSRRKGSKVRLQQVRLVEKIKVTHDTNLFTFLLENQQEPLGLKVGEHIEMRYKCELI